MFEGALGRLTKYMYLNRFEDILCMLTYTDNNVPAYNEKFFHISQMEDAWNENMTKCFEPSWASVLDESMQEFISNYTCPNWMCDGRKPQPFGKLSALMWFAEIVEGRYRPCGSGRPEFD